jgi:hypothetical protein
LATPTSPLGARTLSPTRIVSGDEAGVPRAETGDAVLAVLRLMPRVVVCVVVEEDDRVGDVTFVPILTRGRDNLLPPFAVRPNGVGVAYILVYLILTNADLR